jgi:Tfp pilus assembly protein PilO
MKLSKEKRDRLILVGIVAVALGAGLWQLVIRTRMNRLVQTRALSERAKQKFENANKFLNQSADLQAQAEELSKRIRQIEDVMADPKDTYAWTDDLMRKSREGHDVEFTSEPPLDPGPVQLLADFPYQSVTFGVRGSGQYDDLGKFLADFENKQPYCLVRNVVVTPARQGDSGASTVSTGAYRVGFEFEVTALLKPKL